MGFFWPQRLNPADNGSVRLGRLLHWAALLWAGWWLFLATLWLGGEWQEASYVALAIAALIATAGRGLRFLFAAE